ncbi:MAG: DUF4303 domain-containing protein [Moraxella sp.]|nr:DUF4303 domain-containing protein [Moraxella sp.]
MNFNFGQVEQLAFDYVIDCVTQIHQKYPDERIYTAMFHAFYGDGENIYFPCISVGTEELLQKVVDTYRQDSSYDKSDDKLKDSLRWSGADLAEYMFDDSELFAKCSELAEEVTKYAKEFSGYDFDEECDDEDDNPEIQVKFAQWEKVYDEFLACFPKACKRATAYLLNTDMVERDFIAFANDEIMSLVKPSLTDEQLKKHFPDLI